MFGTSRFNLAITKDGEGLLFKASNRLGTAFELRVSAESLNTLLGELAPKALPGAKELGRIYAEKAAAMVEAHSPSTVFKDAD